MAGALDGVALKGAPLVGNGGVEAAQEQGTGKGQGWLSAAEEGRSAGSLVRQGLLAGAATG